METCVTSNIWVDAINGHNVNDDLATSTTVCSYPTSSPQYQLYHNGAALLFLVFLILATATFLAIVGFFADKFSKP